MKNTYSSLLLMAVPLAFFACKGSTTGTGGSGGTSGNNVTSTSAKTGTTSTGLSTNTTIGVGQTTTTSVTSSTGGPITCSNSYSNIPVGECDILQQNCTNGNTCAPFDGTGGGSSISNCDATAPGLKTVGTACGGDSECAKGLFCFDVCTPPCCPDNQEPCNGGECNLQIGITGTTDFYFVCSFAQSCTLFSTSATNCPANQDCHPGSGISTCSAPSPQTVPEGGNCTFVNDCGNMEACIAPAQAQQAVCRYVCTPGSTAAAGLGGCPSGQTCTATDIFAIDNLGLCAPP